MAGSLAYYSGAAIDMSTTFTGSGGNEAAGNTVTNSLVETENFAFFAKIGQAAQLNSFVNNGLWDSSASLITSYYYISSTLNSAATFCRSENRSWCSATRRSCRRSRAAAFSPRPSPT